MNGAFAVFKINATWFDILLSNAMTFKHSMWRTEWDQMHCVGDNGATQQKVV